MEEHDDFIEDFSVPLIPILGPRAGVFWDVEDYPFPNEDPDSIYDKIVTALKDNGLEEATILIWVYVDETDEYWKEKLVNKTWKASIYFLPRGGKPGRRMFLDFLLWSRDSIDEVSSYPTYLIVISSKAIHDKLFFEKLGGLYYRNFNVFLKLPSYDCDEEPWPKRVIDQVYPFAFGMECESESEQASSKRAKATTT